MIVRDIIPAPHLREYVYRYRLRHFYFNNTLSPKIKPFPPRPEQCLIFYPRGAETIEYAQTGISSTRPRSVISGQFTERINRIITTTEFLMISVEFRPGALFRLTGIDVSELTNKGEDADALPGIADVNARLSGAAYYGEMISIIELYLTNLSAGSSRPLKTADFVLSSLVETGMFLTVDQLSKKAYLSPRQLERKIFQRVGVCPKTFLKITRFHRSLLMRLARPEASWFTIAIHNGYNDYQHLVKEYKTFASNTPTLFVSEELQSPGRMLGLNK